MKFWQVMANCSDTRRFTDSFTDSGHSARRISLVLNEVEMEARVGIGRVPPSTSHSKSTAYGIADVLTIRLLRFMSRITPADFF
jgi:hypothetical protein